MTESPQARQRVSLLFIDSAAIKEIDKFSIIIRKNERSKRNVISSIKKNLSSIWDVDKPVEIFTYKTTKTSRITNLHPINRPKSCEL